MSVYAFCWYLTILKTCEEQQKVFGQSKGGRSNMYNYFDPEGQGITSNAGRDKYDFIAFATKIQALKPLVDAKLASKKNPDD
ncbi:hypothetical protein RvY_13807 [Ramazzottius varieornatus]|uniref:Uncharacterized protein n=1 Tax=Ramazzottius varieornatus TaxID=947166 RepID=A0A1D1VUE4_RAMVA|nr:hypothetical protein RvY_13807 [Ramazzottius varieornatus]